MHMQTEKWYVLVLVYDYEYHSRKRWIRVPATGETMGRSLLTELQGYLTKPSYTEIQSVTSVWCAKNSIDGFIEEVDGLYKETTEKIA